MPGKLTIRPLAAKLTRDTELFGQMDPYCKVVLGKQKVEGSVCYNGGKHPHWDDTLILKRTNEQDCLIELKEKDWLLPDGTIGTCHLNLREVEAQRRVLKWFPVTYNTKPAGQILIEASYEPEGNPFPDQPVIRNQVQQPISTLPTQTASWNPVRGEVSQNREGAGSGYGGAIHGWNPFNNQNPQSQGQIQGSSNPQNQFDSHQSSSFQEAERIQTNYWAPPKSYDHTQPYKYPLFSSQENQRFQEVAQQDFGNQYQGTNQGNEGFVHDYRAQMPNETSQVMTQQEHIYTTNEALPHHEQHEEKGGYDPLQVIRGAWYKGGQ